MTIEQKCSKVELKTIERLRLTVSALGGIVCVCVCVDLLNINQLSHGQTSSS